MSRMQRFEWFRRQRSFRRQNSPPHDRSLRLEPLEDRRMLAVITVNSMADDLVVDGMVTLREAIQAANTDTSVDGSVAGSGTDTILFDGSLSGQTITLDDMEGELTITEALTIDASSLAAGIIIDAGNGTDNTFNTGDGFRIFNIDDGVNFDEIDVELVALTLTGGDVSGDGGAILSQEDLTIISSTISGNSVTGTFARGGGISVRYHGTTTIISSTISGNSAENRGGGISMLGSSGGMIATTMIITSSTISGNSAGGSGGGIHALFDIMTITSSTITGNSAGANGGGILASSGTTTITSSTITGNTANADNIGSYSGGGIEVSVAFIGSTSLTLSHTLVAENGLGNPGNTDDDISGAVETASDFNLIGVDTGLTGITNGTNSNQIGTSASPINPLLGPLADNGGPTQTHALLAGSQAIDAGDPGFATPPNFDQRGAPFVRASGTIDIGAYEWQTVAGLNLVVDTAVDENDGDYTAGDLSLREAVGLANGSIGADTIEFDGALSGQTISLGAELVITEALTIDASSLPADIMIDAGNGTDNTFNTGDGFRIFNIDDGVNSDEIDVELVALTLTGGDVSGDGGAIFSLENLTIISSTITGNSATGAFANGGGIGFRYGETTITSSTISGNSAENRGGGISMLGTNSGASTITLTITSSTISGNSAGSLGGGIHALFDILTITSSTISGNSADADGGGIFVRSATTTITSSTITGNWANADNIGTDSGGGIEVSVAIVGTTSLTLSHTLVAGNGLGNPGSTDDDITGSVETASDFNLIGVDTGITGITNGTNSNQIGTSASPIDPLLGPLADNGGLTQTHALLAGSLAIDAGDPNFITPPEFDQRGVPFTRTFDGDGVGGVRVDMGAVEAQTAGGGAIASFDGDPQINGFDFLSWQQGFGITSGASQSDGDATFDGAVTSGDLSVWELQFGTAAPIVAAATALIATEPVVETSLASGDLVDLALAVALAEEANGVSGKLAFVERSSPLELFSAEQIGQDALRPAPSFPGTPDTSTVSTLESGSSESPGSWEDAFDAVFASVFQ